MAHPPTTPTPPPALVHSVRAARRIAVLTGAGMSAESGIPTFRDALTGLWSRFDPETLATRAGFERDPPLVWGWYEARRRGVLRSRPNAGHLALRALAALQGVDDLHIVTQNVDDLHERAGSAQVTHLHGSLFAPRCLACGEPAPPAAPHSGMPHSEDLDDVGSFAAPQLDVPDGKLPPPRCLRCGGPMRPGVVWFGEDLPAQAWRQAVQCVESADLLLVVGTSGRVYPAASLPDIAERRGKPVWVIDPDEAASPGRRALWRSTAATALPALVAACQTMAP